MRPVDADDILLRLDKRMTYEAGRNHAYLKGIRDAMKEIDAARTVDAIPVEWLVSWINRHPNDLRCVWFVSLEMEWRKEQEAR